MQAMGKQFHAAAFADFTGLEERHVDRILTALEGHNALPAKRSASDCRGTRLPDDFTVPDEWLSWAIEQRRWDPAATREEAENFCNFWQAKTGQAATKLDWRKTWQNWVRNSRRPNGDYRPANKRQSASEWVAYCEERLRWAKDKDFRDGIQTWSQRLEEARVRLHSTKTNVVPFNRADPDSERLHQISGG